MPTAAAMKRAFAWLDSDDDDDDDDDAMYANVPRRRVSFYIAPGRMGSFACASPRVRSNTRAHDTTDECESAGESDGGGHGGDGGGHGGDRDDTNREGAVALAPPPVTPTKTKPTPRAIRPAIVTPPKPQPAAKAQPAAKLTAAQRLRREFAKAKLG